MLGEHEEKSNAFFLKNKDNGEAVGFIESVILRSQYVEYKLSHYLDKAAESLFGFVSVLPGAFSTFRWEAIKGKPLNEFLKGSKDEFGDITKIMHWADANKYLAEDRIMCLEIIAKENWDFILNYVPGAKCLTDPPLSLTGLIKQRRRWFNGSMFASLHVLKHMCKICDRKWSSFFRNIFFMLLYLYMLIQMVLSFIIVGSFYAVFTIFLRAILPYENWWGITNPANIIQNVYIMFLGLTLLLSTTIDINWAENGFRLCSFVMGLFTFLMIGWSIVYALNESIQSISVIALAVFLLTYMIPLFVNIKNLKFWDFVKGLVYVTYLSPTYVNIFTIFSISNIHDVTWGSRPAGGGSAAEVNTEKKKQIKYKDFRSQFLVIWCGVNAGVGYGISLLYNSGYNFVVFYLALFLVGVNVFKISLSLIHMVVSWVDRCRVNSFKRTMHSDVFKDIKYDDEAGKEKAFVVFYSDIRRGSEIRFSINEDPDYRASNIRSSVNDENVYRGFDRNEIMRKQKIANGSKKCKI